MDDEQGQAVTKTIDRLRERIAGTGLNADIDDALQASKRLFEDEGTRTKRVTDIADLLSKQYEHPVLDCLAQPDWPEVTTLDDAYGTTLASMTAAVLEAGDRFPRQSLTENAFEQATATAIRSAVDEQPDTASEHAREATEAAYKAVSASLDAYSVFETLSTAQTSHPDDDVERIQLNTLDAYKRGDTDELAAIQQMVSRAASDWCWDDFDAFDGWEFETLVASYLRTQFESVGRPTTVQDIGVDVICASDSELIHVQTKHYSTHKVTAPEFDKYVAQFSYFDIDRLIIVTSSEFTDPVAVRRTLLSSDKPVDLIDGTGLVKLLSNSPLLRPIG